VIQHIIESRNNTIIISNDGEVELNVTDFVNISNPFFMISKRVGRETNYFDVTSIPFFLKSSNKTEFGSADGSYNFSLRKIHLQIFLKLTEISRMRKENSPFISNEIMELNITLCGLGFEVYFIYYK
jgi:hypothetical protein